MDVCKECHEKDKNVIKCDEDIKKHMDMAIYNDYHTVKVLDTCQICGKTVMELYFCWKYDELKNPGA